MGRGEKPLYEVRKKAVTALTLRPGALASEALANATSDTDGKVAYIALDELRKRKYPGNVKLYSGS